MLLSFVISEAIGVFATTVGLWLLVHDPLNMYGEDTGISFEPPEVPWTI